MLTQEQLEEIRKRLEYAQEVEWYHNVISDVIDEDVPALLAEIERLKADNEYLRMKNEINEHVLQHYRGYA